MSNIVSQTVPAATSVARFSSSCSNCSKSDIPPWRHWKLALKLLVLVLTARLMTDLNDENQNTLNIAPLRLFRGGAEVKNTGKAAPKRSMQQLHKLLLIKDEQSIDEVEQESLRERCTIHLLPMNHFCRCCIDFRLCKDCASSHEHPTIAYNSLEECLNDEAALLDSTV